MVSEADYQTNSDSPEVIMKAASNHTYSPESEIRREALDCSAALSSVG